MTCPPSQPAVGFWSFPWNSETGWFFHNFQKLWDGWGLQYSKSKTLPICHGRCSLWSNLWPEQNVTSSILTALISLILNLKSWNMKRKWFKTNSSTVHIYKQTRVPERIILFIVHSLSSPICIWAQTGQSHAKVFIYAQPCFVPTNDVSTRGTHPTLVQGHPGTQLCHCKCNTNIAHNKLIRRTLFDPTTTSLRD